MKYCEKKYDPHIIFLSQIIDSEKAGLLKCVKSVVSEHLWIFNMLKGPEDCLNLPISTFVIFFDKSEKKVGSKNSVLVVYEILTLFVNILSPAEKYSLSVKASV